MNKKELLEILEKNQKGIASKKEQQTLETFFANRKKHAPVPWSNWDLSEKQLIKVQMYESIQDHIKKDAVLAKNSIHWLRRPAMVAASILLVACSIMLYLRFETDEALPQLSYITKSTSRGQKLTVKLSDGSIVRLNSESSISYPDNFSDQDKRIVQLSGEAFFEVTKDETKPFEVNSGELITTVLGTSFNINAYPEEESTSVTVATGRVRVEPSNLNTSTKLVEVLTPGEQVSLNKQTANLSKSKINLEKHLAWSNNIIWFDRIPLSKAFTMLEKWYDVDIKMATPELGECLINASYENETLVNVLEQMKFINGIWFEFTNSKEVLITGSSCKN